MNRNLIFKLLTIPLFCLGIIVMLNTFYIITRAQVTNEPSVSITADVTSGNPPLAVSFTSTINDPFAGKYPITYDWHFDDGAASTKQNPKHTFADPGEYHVICRVTFWKSPKVTVEAAVNIKVEKKVEPIPVCTADNIQSSPQITSDGFGGAIITWDDVRSGNNVDIYAQRIDSKGELLWTANGVAICTAINNQSFPRITSDGSGGAIITWMDTRRGSGVVNIYAQRIDNTGKALWTKDGILVSSASYAQLNPEIIPDGSGGAIITWKEISEDNQGIYAQRVDSTGKTLWPIEGVAISTQVNFQLFYLITMIPDGSGGAIISWPYDQSGKNQGIYAQRVDSTGKALWTTGGVAVCTAVIRQGDTQITIDGSGGAIISWSDDRSGDNENIYARRIDSTGKLLWTANGVAICAAVKYQRYPKITANGSGGAVITWNDYRSGYWDIYAQCIDSTGKSLWTADGLVICTYHISKYNPRITSDGSGGAIITWQDPREGTPNWALYAQRIDSTGKLLWSADGVPVRKGPNQHKEPQMISDGSSGAIIVWQEYINSTSSDIYAQWITKDGEVK